MTATLREAAEALLVAWSDETRPFEPSLFALKTALAAPPEPGWEEGAQAEREETVRWLTDFRDGRGMFRSRNALAEELMARALPIPSAPTQAAPACTCATTGAGECPVFDAPPAPEAKTAESGAPRCAACGHAEDRHNSAIANGCCEGEWERCGCFRFRAPVEPEETHR